MSRLTDEKADEYIENILKKIRTSLVVKAKEYVRNEDRMHNFNRASAKTGESRERAIRGFRLKHDVSVDDLLDDMDNGHIPTVEYVTEKYGDIINYNILELMSVLHKIDEHELQKPF